MNGMIDINELKELSVEVRDMIKKRHFCECEELITQAMSKFPHAPQPHNLYGILLENLGDHLTALKHFKAAWDLDPAYIPARYNLNRYGSFYPTGQSAYVEEDCFLEQDKEFDKLAGYEDKNGNIVMIR